MTAQTDAINRFHHEAGKGSRSRPVDHEKYSRNYDLIFGSKHKGENHATEKRLFSQDNQQEHPN